MQASSPRRFIPYTTLALLVLFSGSAIAAGPAPGGGDIAASASTGDVVLLVLYILLALLFSFLCSIAEAVLLSITPSYIASLKEKKPKRAQLLRRLKVENVDRSLAAILTLNTIAHTVGAIGAGAKATVVFGSAWFGLFSAVMTLLILFFSEIIPKTLGAVYWNKLAGPSAFFVRFLIVVLYPLIFVSELLTRLIAHGKDVHVFSREEFLAMADMGAQSGHLREHESRIIRSLFRAEKLTAEDIMTPRTVIVAFPEEMTVSEVLQAHPENPFSRLPIYKDHIDNITGFILKDDLLLAKAEGRGDEKIVELKRTLSTVTADMSMAALLEYLFDERLHIALVAGDYGGTRGLVTLEDVVETLLGLEIVDEMDEVVDMQAFARRQWEKRAGALGLSIENPEPRTPQENLPEDDQPEESSDEEESRPAPSKARSN